MIACSQCFISLAQAIAIAGTCLIPMAFNGVKLFRNKIQKKLKFTLDIDDR